jgi:hypothetical protein
MHRGNRTGLRLLAATLTAGGIALFLTQRSHNRIVRRYADNTQAVLRQQFDISERPLSQDDAHIQPLRTLGLITLQTQVQQSDRLAHIATMNMQFAGAVHIYTLVLRPNWLYNMPLLELDVVCLGPQRMVALGLIQKTPAPAIDEKPFEYWQRKLAHLTTFETVSWTREYLLAPSLHIRGSANDDEQLLEVVRAYLEIYTGQLARAEPQPAAIQQQLKLGSENYMDMLEQHQGQSMAILSRLIGPEVQQRFMRQVLYGLGASSTHKLMSKI